jgi:hypothetical protein
VEKAEQQQMRDADELLRHEQVAFQKYVELYERLRTNTELYVERSNHELAALGLLIEQKRQNLISLDAMRQGKAVPPGPPVTQVGQNFTPPPEVAKPVGAVPQNGAKGTS